MNGVGLTVGLEAQRKFFEKVKSNLAEGESTITYTSKIEDQIAISPKLLVCLSRYERVASHDYLDLLAKEGPIQQICPEYNVSFPALAVKVVNNSSRPLNFSTAGVDVQSSQVDVTPLPILELDVDAGILRLELTNEGWGPIDSCRIKFSISPTQWRREPEIYRFEKQFGSFDEHLVVDVSDEVRQSGAPAKYIAAAIEYRKLDDANRNIDLNDEKNQRIRNELEKRAGELVRLESKLKSPFVREDQAGEAYLTGTITYSWHTQNGRSFERTSRFRAGVLTGVPEIGGPAPVSGEYEAMLRRDGENYQLDVPISQSVKPGDVSHFVVTLAAPCSSLHSLKLRLVTTAGDTVESKPIALHILLPRGAVSALRKSDQPKE